MTNMLTFRASNPDGRKAQIRQSDDPYETGYSVFTWHDNGTGVILWREKHELNYEDAYNIAAGWLNQW